MRVKIDSEEGESNNNAIMAYVDVDRRLMRTNSKYRIFEKKIATLHENET